MTQQIVVYRPNCPALTPDIVVQFGNQTDVTVTDNVTGGHDYALNAILTDVGSGRGVVEMELKIQGGVPKYWVVEAGGNGVGTFGGSGVVHTQSVTVSGNYLTDTFVVPMIYLGTDGSGNYKFKMRIVDDTANTSATYTYTMPQSALGSAWTPQNAVGNVGGYNSSCGTFSNTTFSIEIITADTDLTYAAIASCTSNHLACTAGCSSASNTCGPVIMGDEGGNMNFTESSNTGSDVTITASA